MESFPFITTRHKYDNQCSDSGRDCVTEPGCTTNEVKPTGPLLAPEFTVDSTHRDKHNTGCIKCLQVKVNPELKPVRDEYNLTNCSKIGEYLEKGNNDNYFEKYLLPAKVLSKFALLLGKDNINLKINYLSSVSLVCCVISP